MLAVTARFQIGLQLLALPDKSLDVWISTLEPDLKSTP